MNLSKYENLYACARDAEIATKEIDAVVAILRQHTETPVTPKEIGMAIFGEDYAKPVQASYPYDYNWKKAIQRAHLGQMMRHLHKARLIKRAYVDGESYIDVHDEWVIDENKQYNVPKLIKVWDATGKEYCIPNPEFDEWKARCAHASGHYVTVRTERVAKIKAWVWVGD